MSLLPSWLPHYYLLISNAQCSHLNLYWWTMVIWGVFTSCLSDKREPESCWDHSRCHIVFYSLPHMVPLLCGWLTLRLFSLWLWWEVRPWRFYSWCLMNIHMGFGCLQTKEQDFCLRQKPPNVSPTSFWRFASSQWWVEVPSAHLHWGASLQFYLFSILEAYDLSALTFKMELNACCPF